MLMIILKDPALKNNNFISKRKKGAGWTKSCGTGATAAAALLIYMWYLDTITRNKF